MLLAVRGGDYAAATEKRQKHKNGETCVAKQTKVFVDATAATDGRARVVCCFVVGFAS